MLRQDKRGLSEIIGYTLLIVLAIGMAAGVYSFLKFYVPKDQIKCPNDVSLIIDSAVCTTGQLNLTLSNRGFFNLQGAYIKVGDAGKTVKKSLNCPDQANCVLNFGTKEQSEELTVGESWNHIYLDNTLTGAKEIEIQPIIIVNRTIAVCDAAIITQKINCVSPDS